MAASGVRPPLPRTAAASLLTPPRATPFLPRPRSSQLVPPPSPPYSLTRPLRLCPSHCSSTHYGLSSLRHTSASCNSFQPAPPLLPAGSPFASGSGHLAMRPCFVTPSLCLALLWLACSESPHAPCSTPACDQLRSSATPSLLRFALVCSSSRSTTFGLFASARLAAPCFAAPHPALSLLSTWPHALHLVASNPATPSLLSSFLPPPPRPPPSVFSSFFFSLLLALLSPRPIFLLLYHLPLTSLEPISTPETRSPLPYPCQQKKKNSTHSTLLFDFSTKFQILNFFFQKKINNNDNTK